MKTTDLIKQLIETVARHGDLPVYLSDSNTDNGISVVPVGDKQGPSHIVLEELLK